jgi:F0F1-type ATP synthase membrane subunit b/b'
LAAYEKTTQAWGLRVKIEIIMSRKLMLLVTGLAAVGLITFAVTPAFAAAKERHPKIRAALVALEAAKTEMQGAAHDFGGHRVEALADCDKAIAQLRLCLQSDKN